MRRLVLLLLVPLPGLAEPAATASTEEVKHTVEVYLGLH